MLHSIRITAAQHGGVVVSSLVGSGQVLFAGPLDEALKWIAEQGMEPELVFSGGFGAAGQHVPAGQLGNRAAINQVSIEGLRRGGLDVCGAVQSPKNY